MNLHHIPPRFYGGRERSGGLYSLDATYPDFATPDSLTTQKGVSPPGYGGHLNEFCEQLQTDYAFTAFFIAFIFVYTYPFKAIPKLAKGELGTEIGPVEVVAKSHQ